MLILTGFIRKYPLCLTEYATRSILVYEEDYSSVVLPMVLSHFALSHPAIRVDVYVAEAVELKAKLDKGELDFALCTEIMNHGTVVHRDPVVWVTSAHYLIHEQDPLPIAVNHDGCIFRKWTIEALEKQRKAYRIVYVSTSVSGIIAAVENGLAVAPLGLSYLPKHLRALGPESGFPLLIKRYRIILGLVSFI